jgi:hypothetical protein
VLISLLAAQATLNENSWGWISLFAKPLCVASNVSSITYLLRERRPVSRRTLAGTKNARGPDDYQSGLTSAATGPSGVASNVSSITYLLRERRPVSRRTLAGTKNARGPDDYQSGLTSAATGPSGVASNVSSITYLLCERRPVSRRTLAGTKNARGRLLVCFSCRRSDGRQKKDRDFSRSCV